MPFISSRARRLRGLWRRPPARRLLPCSLFAALREYFPAWWFSQYPFLRKIGLILPIMPGWVFLIRGLTILADYFPPVKRLVEWAKAKARGHPKW